MTGPDNARTYNYEIKSVRQCAWQVSTLMSLHYTERESVVTLNQGHVHRTEKRLHRPLAGLCSQ